MAEPTIQDVFGAGATQDATTLHILKANLPTLTATATNRGEQLFMAILLKAKSNLTTTARDADLDRSVAIESSFDQVTSRTVNGVTTNYYQSGLSLSAQKVNTSTAISADDY